MKEFFGFGGYARTPEGYFSWQHITYVTSIILLAIFLAVFLGRRNRNRPAQEKNRVLVVAAILIDTFEIFKITVFSLRGHSAEAILYNLPLFLCSIQLITLPLAAFAKGRVKEAALDFVSIFGVLGMVLGTYGAGQNYNAYPVLSIDNVVSGITHSISGFAAIYILVSGMASMKKSNIVISYTILLAFCVTAYVVNRLIDYNYMFLMRDDGTPYVLVYQLVKGDPILYPLAVVVLFLIYITLFYAVFYLLSKKKKA